MATRTSIVVVDDLDGTEGAKTLKFGLDGTNYEIDLSEPNAAGLRASLAPFVAAGRKVTTPGGRASRQVKTGIDPAEVRAWARSHDIDIADRGRVPNALTEAFKAGDPSLAVAGGATSGPVEVQTVNGRPVESVSLDPQFSGVM